VTTSFDQYVVARGPALLRFAFLLVRDHHLAEDLVQEALVRSHRRWRVIEREDPDAYVRRVVLNQFLSWRRRRSFWERPVSTIGDDAGLVGPDPATAIVDRHSMQDMLQCLSRQQRAVIVLRFYEDLDDAMIGALLDCSPTTVRVHLSKAMARLRAATRTGVAMNGERL